jgi:hypothetical protein
MSNKLILPQTATYNLGDSGGREVSTKVVQVTFNGLTGGIAITARLSGTNRTAVPIPFRRRYLNGAVGDDTYVSGSLTSDSLIEINAAGVEIFATYTYVSGTGPGLIDYVDLKG